MKLLSKLMVLLVLTPTVYYSQIISDYGLKFGMVSSKLKSESGSSDSFLAKIYDESRLGPVIGGFIRYYDLQFLDIESSLFYLQKGGKDKHEMTTAEHPQGSGKYETYDMQLDYLQFQTALRPYYSNKNYQLYAILGGSINYFLSAKGAASSEDDFKKFVFSYTMGIGCSIDNIVNYPVFIEIQYNSDVTSFSDMDKKCRNRAWLFLLGVCL